MPDKKAKNSNTTIMLRAIINGQSSMKAELLRKIDKNQKEIIGRIDVLEVKIDKVDARVDKLGKTLAVLDEDAPTREEYDGLEKRVKKVEKKLILG